LNNRDYKEKEKRRDDWPKLSSEKSKENKKKQGDKLRSPEKNRLESNVRDVKPRKDKEDKKKKTEERLRKKDFGN